MEVLKMLEDKVASLVDLVKEFKEENSRLMQENEQLCSKLATIESLSTTDAQRIDELSQEKALTKLLVDDLIKGIDSLIKAEHQQ